MIEPKYKVGEFVYWKQQVQNYKDIIEPLLMKAKAKDYISIGEHDLYNRAPHKFQIVEITTQICYGGYQVHYTLRSGNADFFKLTEVELVAEM